MRNRETPDPTLRLERDRGLRAASRAPRRRNVAGYPTALLAPTLSRRDPTGEEADQGGGMTKYIPGLVLIFAIGLPGWFIQDQITINGKTVISAVAIAILLGILI